MFLVFDNAGYLNHTASQTALIPICKLFSHTARDILFCSNIKDSFSYERHVPQLNSDNDSRNSRTIIPRGNLYSSNYVRNIIIHAHVSTKYRYI